MTLILGLPEQMFQMPHLSVMENICVKSFLKIHPQLYKSWAKQIQTDPRTHAHTTDRYCENYVWLTSSGLNKKKF